MKYKDLAFDCNINMINKEKNIYKIQAVNLIACSQAFSFYKKEEKKKPLSKAKNR